MTIISKAYLVFPFSVFNANIHLDEKALPLINSRTEKTRMLSWKVQVHAMYSPHLTYYLYLIWFGAYNQKPVSERFI